MTTAVAPRSPAATKVRRRTRHEMRAAFNQRILTWLSIGIFLFLYIPILILIIYSFNANTVVGVGPRWCPSFKEGVGELSARRRRRLQQRSYTRSEVRPS
jgi:hypothetical protein